VCAFAVIACGTTLRGSTAGARSFAGNPSGDATFRVASPPRPLAPGGATAEAAAFVALAFSTCGAAATAMATAATLFDRCPSDPAAAVLAAQDASFQGCSVLRATVAREEATLGSYWLAVEGATGADEGDFELSLECFDAPTLAPTLAPTKVSRPWFSPWVWEAIE
jgi:hypothetical protein